jgi:hypothetical protein
MDLDVGVEAFGRIADGKAGDSRVMKGEHLHRFVILID